MAKLRHLVSLSGGMDSVTVLRRAIVTHAVESNGSPADPGDVQAVSFYYGSKHNPYELAMAKQVAKKMGVPHREIDVSVVLSSLKSALLGNGQVPEGHYEADSMKQTVVPGRNLLFISAMASIAESEGFDVIWLGIHAGDHHIYPDCRPEFFFSADQTVRNSTDGKVSLQAPFLYDNKTKILRWGLAVGVDYAMTRTCYKDQMIACGKCGSCQERLAAFREIGMEDPLKYEFRGELPK